MSESVSSASVTDWQTIKKSGTERVKYIHDTGTLSDCTFIVGTENNRQELKGHKMWLAIASPVFEAMFYGSMVENSPIAIPDIEPDAFKDLLRYIYTDTITFTSFDQACNVCYAAKKYMLPHLVEKSIQYLSSPECLKYFCKAYEFGKSIDDSNLMNACLESISNQTLNVLLADSFAEADLETIKTLFDQSQLEINTELDLFSALEVYSKKNYDESTSVSKVREVLKKIRLLTLTPMEFATIAETTNFLTESEKLSIFINICSTDSKRPVPDGFSSSRTNRKRKVPCISQFGCNPHDFQKRQSNFRYN